MTTFYIVRHGETEWNKLRLLQGKTDSPLTEEGLKQAHESAQFFKSIEFADAFSSDLLRAKRTAEIIAMEHNLAVKTNEFLRERNFGKYEGQHVQIYKQRLREMLTDLTEEQKASLKIDGEVESDQEVITRLLTFLRQTALAHPDKNVLVVTHSGIIRILLFHLGWMNRDQLETIKIKNLATVKLDCDGTEFFIRHTDNIQKE